MVCYLVKTMIEQMMIMYIINLGDYCKLLVIVVGHLRYWLMACECSAMFRSGTYCLVMATHVETNRSKLFILGFCAHVQSPTASSILGHRTRRSHPPRHPQVVALLVLAAILVVVAGPTLGLHAHRAGTIYNGKPDPKWFITVAIVSS